MNSLQDLTPQQFEVLFNEEYHNLFNTFMDIDSSSSSFVEKSLETCDESPTENPKSTTSVVKISKGKGANEKKRSCTSDHVIAERKRREKLSQQFISLSALVPGLKKIDKASILGDCIEYVKSLKVKVKTLEEKTLKETMESVFFVRNFQVSSLSHTDSASTDEPLPVVKVFYSETNVMIRIHCKNHKGVVAQILLETENLHLSIASLSFIPFGKFTLDITIMAQMETGFHMIVEDLEKKLRSSMVQFMIKDIPQN